MWSSSKASLSNTIALVMWPLHRNFKYRRKHLDHDNTWTCEQSKGGYRVYHSGCLIHYWHRFHSSLKWWPQTEYQDITVLIVRNYKPQRNMFFSSLQWARRVSKDEQRGGLPPWPLTLTLSRGGEMRFFTAVARAFLTLSQQPLRSFT